MVQIVEDFESFSDKREAKRLIREIVDDAIVAVNNGLSCDGELVAYESHMARDGYGIRVGTKTGKIDILSNLLFNNNRRGKISTNLEILVNQYAGYLEIVCEFDKTHTDFGRGINSKPVTAETFDEIRDIVMNTAVPKIIKGANICW